MLEEANRTQNSTSNYSSLLFLSCILSHTANVSWLLGCFRALLNFGVGFTETPNSQLAEHERLQPVGSVSV